MGRAAIVTRLVASFAFGVFGAFGGAACLVTVDESLVDMASTKGVNPPNDGDVNPPNLPNDAGATETGGADAAPEAAYAGMACGAQHCFPSTGQACCTGSDGDPDPSHGTCGKPADCKTGDYFVCMGPADCADLGGDGRICCATDFGGGGFSHSGCKTACAAADIELCDPNGQACPTPRTCARSTEYVGLYACQ